MPRIVPALVIVLLPLAAACPSTRYRTQAFFGTDERELVEESVGKLLDLQARVLGEAQAGLSTVRLMRESQDASEGLARGLQDRAARTASYLRSARDELEGLESVTLAWFGELREDALATVDPGARDRALAELEARRTRYSDLRGVVEAADLVLDSASALLADLARFAASMGSAATHAELEIRGPELEQMVEQARAEVERCGQFAATFLELARV
jgi:hypothetical protein